MKNKIQALRDLASHPKTPTHEAMAAKVAAERLEKRQTGKAWLHESEASNASKAESTKHAVWGDWYHA